MAHKYYDELNIDSTTTCLFNTAEREVETVNGIRQETKRQKRFDEERQIYGFDSRETWALNFTAATWLHSHLKMYLDIGGKVVDLSFHRFDIPVLLEDQIESEPSGVSKYAETVKTMTQKEAIELSIAYLEAYLKSEQESLQADSGQELNKIESLGLQKGQMAFRIFAELLPAMWW